MHGGKRQHGLPATPFGALPEKPVGPGAVDRSAEAVPAGDGQIVQGGRLVLCSGFSGQSVRRGLILFGAATEVIQDGEGGVGDGFRRKGENGHAFPSGGGRYRPEWIHRRQRATGLHPALRKDGQAVFCRYGMTGRGIFPRAHVSG